VSPPTAGDPNKDDAVDNRTRFIRTMRFDAVDHPPLLAPGPWSATMQRWRAEGLGDAALSEYFDLEPFGMRSAGIETLWCPSFTEKILEEAGDYVVKINARGVKERNYRDGMSMPEHLEYPIKSADDLGWVLERLDPDTPGRVADGWLAKARADRDAGAMLFSNGGMYFAFLNEHMGTERLMYVYFDRPDFVHAVNDRLATLCEQALTTAMAAIELDYVGYHEDMAYKNGPLISPAMFREFMTPYYRRVEAIARPAVDLHIMDSDGDIRKLIPLWLEVGVNVFGPLEVAAGMDVVALREQYGRDIGMTGGFDKRILAAGPEAVHRELARIRPVIEGGGYVPNCDHGVPPDVPFASICALMDGLKSIYGIR